MCLYHLISSTYFYCLENISGKGQKVCLSRGEFLEVEDIVEEEYCESIGIKNVYLSRL